MQGFLQSLKIFEFVRENKTNVLQDTNASESRSDCDTMG